MSYADFLASKAISAPTDGVEIDRSQLHPSLFEFQADLVTWALRKGRAAIFAGTGMGKTRMQLEWARLVDVPALILGPLAVAQQTVEEATLLGIDCVYVRNQAEADALSEGTIAISNYERLDSFDPGCFGAVVLDESSILKSFSGVTKKALVEAFRRTRYRLCCTATPAPNDIEEICNHADFLSVMSPQEMRSTFFIAESRAHQSKYRLKGHARSAFFRWLASWGMSISKPSDLGYPDGDFILPPLNVEPIFVETGWKPADRLFASTLKGVTERAQVRRDTVAERVDKTVELVTAEAQQWLIWVGRNDEGRQVSARLADAGRSAVLVEGSDTPEVKAQALKAFADGEIQVLVTKPSIAGWGMNFQGCSRMAFVGVDDSWESYYQAIRRCWRFGQRHPVHCYVVLADVQEPIFSNLMRKEAQAREMTKELVANVAEYERAEIAARSTGPDPYAPKAELKIPDFMEAS